MTINRYNEKIFEKFIDLVQKTIIKGVSETIQLDIPDVTAGDSLADIGADTTAIPVAQDYYFRNMDQMGSSSRNDTSPMSPPLLLWAMQGGAPFVKLCDIAWSSKTIEEMSIKRLHESEGERKISYTTTYKTVKIIGMTELLIDKEWYSVIMAQVGEVKKEHTKVELAGGLGGNTPAQRNFITGSSS